MNNRIALMALIVSACYTTPNGESCDAIPLPDAVVTDCDEAADLDVDGIEDCDDADIDGDGLRNVWDCSPLDGDEVVTYAGGRCDDPLDRADGALVVPTGTTELFAPTHTRLLSDASAGGTTLSVADGSDFREGDEILIVDQQGEGAGTYEFVTVADADGSSITVEPYLIQDYDAADLVRVQRVPHYDAVTIDGTLTTTVWDSDEGGGLIVFRTCGALDVSGRVDVDDLGFAGGVGVIGHGALPTTGESQVGPSVEPEVAEDESEDYAVGACNGGGGGAPYGDEDALRDQNAGGAGGSYGTTGEYSYSSDGEKYAQPGEIYGSADLSVWHLGSGGGGGAADREEDGTDDENISGSGGAGAGVVVIFAVDSATVAGTISAVGERGGDATSQAGLDSDGFPVGGEPGGGGGGAGGLVMLVSRTIAVTSEDEDEGVTVRWGEGGWPAGSGAVVESDTVRGGKGGYGYVRFDAETLETPGTVTTGGNGAFEGDYTQWCWESVDLPERPCDTDADGDGALAWACGGDDCDDEDADVHPGADEIAGDGLDQDCDGLDLCGEATWIQGGLQTLRTSVFPVSGEVKP